MTQTSKLTQKIFAFGALTLSLLLFWLPGTFAQGFAPECDVDGDGYISFPPDGVDVILGNTMNVNGNYSSTEWNNFFQKFKTDAAGSSLCSALNFKKGAEPTRCDWPIVDSVSGVYDPSKVTTVSGNMVYPGAFDKPDNGIDENCDGVDGKLIENGTSGNLGSLADRVIYMLSRAVVVISVMILIWGGILYSTAAGDERKTSKARKAIMGAVIGLIVGLLAPSITSFIIASLG